MFNVCCLLFLLYNEAKLEKDDKWGFEEREEHILELDKASFVVMPLLKASLAARQSSGPGLQLLLFLLRRPVSSCLAPDNGISVCLKTNCAAP